MAASLWKKQPLQCLWLISLVCMPWITSAALFWLSVSVDPSDQLHFSWVVGLCSVATFGMATGVMVSTTFFAYLGFVYQWQGLLYGGLSYLIAAYIGYSWVFSWLKPLLNAVWVLKPSAAARLNAFHKAHVQLVLVGRVTPVLPFALTTTFFRAVKVPLTTMLALSAVGMLPRATAAVYLGHLARVHHKSLSIALSADWFILLTVSLVVAGLTWLIFIIIQYRRS